MAFHLYAGQLRSNFIDTVAAYSASSSINFCAKLKGTHSMPLRIHLVHAVWPTCTSHRILFLLHSAPDARSQQLSSEHWVVTPTSPCQAGFGQTANSLRRGRRLIILLSRPLHAHLWMASLLVKGGDAPGFKTKLNAAPTRFAARGCQGAPPMLPGVVRGGIPTTPLVIDDAATLDALHTLASRQRTATW